DRRPGKGSASLTGFVRGPRDREIEKITLHRGVTAEEIRSFLGELADRRSRKPVSERLTSSGVRRIAIGKLSVEDTPQDAMGIEAARRVCGPAGSSAETLRRAANEG